MRIALVNDTVTALEAMRRALFARPGHELAWVAHDGLEATELCARDTPDLVLMDLLMPRLDGVEATRRIMTHSPCAIVIVTADVGSRSSKVFEAMGAGALDAVNTPVLQQPSAPGGSDALLAKVETIRRLLGADRANGRTAPTLPATPPVPRPHLPLVAIGASAGGPTALARVFSHLPKEFPAPIVVVQHVDAQFAPGLATWLGSQTALQVRLARDGDWPETGAVLLAAADQHLVFKRPAQLAYTRDPEHSPYRASVDTFFLSAKRFWPGDVIGVVLSGMGRDGAQGLLALRAGGHHTIAQDPRTSIASGMPRAAADLDAAREILGLDKIGPRLRNMVSQKRKAHG